MKDYIKIDKIVFNRIRDLVISFARESIKFKNNHQPRWIADLNTNELYERQSDGSYKASHKMVVI